MAKANFNLKKAGGRGESLILLIIRWRNKKLCYSTRESIDPKFWEGKDKSKRNFQRAKEVRQFPEYPEFNARLDWIMAAAKTVFRKFLNDNDGRPPEVEELKNLLDEKLRKGEGQADKTLFGFIEQYIEEGKARVNDKTGKVLAKATIGIYKNALATLRRYAIHKRISLDFKSITLDFYHDFTAYLAKDCGYSNNYIGKQTKMLKTFMHDATERGVNTNLAFRSKKFKVIQESTTSIYLNETELEELFTLDLSDSECLDRVRDLFLVGCHTGLRFSDFTSIRPENISGDMITIKTKKTGEEVVIPIHRRIKFIMEKYKGKYPNSLPPAISNVNTNRFLKILAQRVPSLCVDIQTSITRGGVHLVTTKKKYELMQTHTARRSFATNLHIAKFPSIAIMKITGHRSEKQFMKYIKITPKENAELLQEHWKKRSKKLQ